MNGDQTSEKKDVSACLAIEDGWGETGKGMFAALTAHEKVNSRRGFLVVCLRQHRACPESNEKNF